MQASCSRLRRWLAWCLLPPCLLLAACATATGEVPMAPASFELHGEGPFQRFIVRYRADSAPGRDKAEVPARLERTADAAALAPPPVLTWQRRLAVDADVFTADRPLDRAAASALMQAFDDDPDVEYIEVDRRMGIDPIRPMPMRGD